MLRTARIDQIPREYIFFEVIRSRRTKVSKIGHHSVVSYLNDFKFSQETVNLNPIANGGVLPGNVHAQIIQ